MTKCFILFGTEGCHLCDQAKELLNNTEVLLATQIAIEEIDICDEQQWLDMYSIRIPVLYYPKSGAELGWPFDQSKLIQFIDEAN